MRGGLLAVGQRRILKFGDLAGLRIQAPDPAAIEFREPDVAVGTGKSRMNAVRSRGYRQREFLRLAGLRVQPHDGIAAPVIGNPDHPVLVLDGAPRPQTDGCRKVIFDIGDVHRARTEGAHQGPIFRHVFRRCRLRRIGTEGQREVRHEIFESSDRSSAALPPMITSRIIRPAAPSHRHPGFRRHLCLKRMAGLQARRKERILWLRVVILGLGEELPALIGGEVAPRTGRFCSAKSNVAFWSPVNFTPV